MTRETSLGGPGGSFAPTLWTEVLKAKDRCRPALERLVQAYWKPIYFYVRRRGNDVETSKDLTQGFFTAFLERDFLQYVEQGRGKFRTYLLRTLDHYLADEHDRAIAKKRGGGKAVLSLNFAEAEMELPSGEETPDALCRRQWALEIIQRALESLRANFPASEFEVLQIFLAVGENAPSMADVAVRLGVTETDVKNRLRGLRKRYREAILDEIRAYVENEEQAREELRDLFSSFS